MLDKSLPYYNIIMQRRSSLSLPLTQQPSDFIYRTFQNGDETYWSSVVTAVGEFENSDQAINYFNQFYTPYLPLHADRIFLAFNMKGHISGTIMS